MNIQRRVHPGDEQEKSMAAQIVHVITVGDSVDMQQSLLAGQSLGLKDQGRLADPIRKLDLALTQLAAALPVDIMPGPHDPANFFFAAAAFALMFVL